MLSHNSATQANELGDTILKVVTEAYPAREEAYGAGFAVPVCAVVKPVTWSSSTNPNRKPCS